MTKRRGDSQTNEPGKYTRMIRYIADGRHAFVAIDNVSKQAEFIKDLASNFSGQAHASIDGKAAISGKPFVDALVEACNKLINSIGVDGIPDARTVSGYVEETMRIFRTHEEQGFLIFFDIDPMISSQGTFEIEGALRSVMQRYSDIAIVLCGSNEAVNTIGQPDRPFYCSFQVFRLS